MKPKRIADGVAENLRWTYCGDGENLPEEDGFYLVTRQIRETGERFVGKSRFGVKKGWDDPLNFAEVIAWQPLPEPYRMDRD